MVWCTSQINDDLQHILHVDEAAGLSLCCGVNAAVCHWTSIPLQSHFTSALFCTGGCARAQHVRMPKTHFCCLQPTLPPLLFWIHWMDVLLHFAEPSCISCVAMLQKLMLGRAFTAQQCCLVGRSNQST